MDFSYIVKNGKMDIDFTETDNKNILIINAIYEEERLTQSRAKLQPILRRGGSIKDLVFNVNGSSGGSKIWFYIKQYAGEQLISSIKTEIDQKLNRLIKDNIIESFSIDSVDISYRTLNIGISYKVNYKVYQLYIRNNLDI